MCCLPALLASATGPAVATEVRVSLFCLRRSVEEHDDSSAIIAASTVVSFLVLVIFGFLIFFRITRKLRRRQEKRRKQEAMAAEAGESLDGYRKRRRRGTARNAFEEKEWEGVPVREQYPG